MGAIMKLVLAAQISLWAPHGCQGQEVCVCMANLAELAAEISLLQGPEPAKTK